MNQTIKLETELKNDLEFMKKAIGLENFEYKK